MLSKRRIYVVLLLLLIIFVSTSFYFILNIKEGLCLPNCDDMKFDEKTGELPKCTSLQYKFLQPKDASKILSITINPFIKSINEHMNTTYNYTLIYTLYNKNTKIGDYVNEPQIQMNKYLTDFSNNRTNQDVMDNLVKNLSTIQTNTILQKNTNKDSILKSLNDYKNNRPTTMKPLYEKMITSIKPYGEKILIENECSNDTNKNYYKDETFRILIKEEGENPIVYGENSSFHKISDYLLQGLLGKLGELPK